MKFSKKWNAETHTMTSLKLFQNYAKSTGTVLKEYKRIRDPLLQEIDRIGQDNSKKDKLRTMMSLRTVCSITHLVTNEKKP